MDTIDCGGSRRGVGKSIVLPLWVGLHEAVCLLERAPPYEKDTKALRGLEMLVSPIKSNT